MSFHLSPCMVNEAGDDTIHNEYSWNKNASVIFLDQVYLYIQPSCIMLSNIYCHSHWMSVIPMVVVVLATLLLLPRMCMHSSNCSLRNSHNTRHSTFTLPANHVSQYITISFYANEYTSSTYAMICRCWSLHPSHWWWIESQQQRQLQLQLCKLDWICIHSCQNQSQVSAHRQWSYWSTYPIQVLLQDGMWKLLWTCAWSKHLWQHGSTIPCLQDLDWKLLQLTKRLFVSSSCHEMQQGSNPTLSANWHESLWCP